LSLSLRLQIDIYLKKH